MMRRRNTGNRRPASAEFSLRVGARYRLSSPYCRWNCLCVG